MMSRGPLQTTGRVLIVDFGLKDSFGGTKRVLCNVAPQLLARGWKVQTLFHSDGPFVELLRAQNVPVDVIPPHLRRLSSASDGALARPQSSAGVRRDPTARPRRTRWRQLLRDLRSHQQLWWSHPRSAPRLAAYLIPRPDILHFNWDCRPGTPWVSLARRERIPYFTHEHGTWRRPPSAFCTIASQAAGSFCLTSRRMEEIRAFCTKANPILLPNGVDPEQFKPRRGRAEVRRELKVTEGIPLILTAGHLQQWKGQHLIPPAARALRGEGVRFSWVICGSPLDPQYTARLDADVAAAGLTDCVTILGPRTDMPDLYAAADLLVHTSVMPEPFGMVLIESMVLGTPVVAPRDGAVREIVRNECDGLLYAPGDVAEMVAAIKALARSPESLKRLGDSARLRVLHTFHINGQVDTLIHAYESVLRSQGEATPRRV